MASELGLDYVELTALYERIPTVSAVRLAAVENILAILVKSFWEDGLISCRRSMLSVRVENYISDHLADKISVDELLREFSLSRGGLYRLFREEFGTSVNEYIMTMRMERAEKMLTETDASVSDVAASVGYSDYNYFIRAFKKRNGTSPLKYRRSRAT